MTSPLNSALPSQFGTTESPARPAQPAWVRAWAWASGGLRPAGGTRLLPVLAALGLLLALGGLLMHGQSSWADATQRADAAQRAVGRLSELAAVAAAAEAGQRGHAITGDPALLAPVQQAPAREAALLEELRALASEDPAQYSRLIALGPLLTQRTEQLAAAADLRQRGGTAGAAAAVAAVENRRLPEQIQRALAELQAQADATAAAAREQAASARRWNTRLTIGACLLALVLTGGALLHGQQLAARLARAKRDRRAQHEGDARLKQAHARLLESSVAPICFIDREGRVRRGNPAAERLWAPATLAGQALVDSVSPEDRRKTERALEAAATEPQTLQHRWRRADGSVLHLRWSLRAVHDDGLLVAVAQDDTEARTLAQALADQAGALQQAQQVQAQAAERAGSADRRLNDFLATLSRCLRQPLSALLQQTANGQQGLHGTQDATVARAWTQALERTRGLQEAVEHVLLLGRMEAGQLELQREAFDVWDTLNRTVGLVQATAERKGLRMTLSLPEDLGYAHGDTRRVEQALLNVLHEAVGSCNEGELHVAARRGSDGLIHFEVAHPRADGGAADLEELLSPLHDADKPASADQLMRLLAVAMARTLLQRMGGSLTATLQPPRGCVFEATLPADQLPQR
jgi:PAS domain S-box-containing protein